MIGGAIGPKDDDTEELSNKSSAYVGVKTGGSRVGGPKQCVLGSMVTGSKGHNVYPGSGPLDGGKTLLRA